jgi:hypothetical protein
MKYKIVLLSVLLFYCHCVKVQQLFDVLSQELQHNSGNTASSNNSIVTNSPIISHQNNLKEEEIKPNIQNVSQAESIMNGPDGQLNDLRNKLVQIKEFNTRLEKILKENDDFENKKGKFPGEVESLVKDSYRSFDTKLYSGMLKDKNLQQFKSNLTDKLDEINMLETGLKDVTKVIKQIENPLENLTTANTNTITVSDSANIKNLKANEFDLGVIKGGSYFVDTDINSSIVYCDKKLPIKTLAEFHRAMKAIKSMCGEDFTKCNYLDKKTIEQEGLNQKTLLTEIQNLTQIIEKLSAE